MAPGTDRTQYREVLASLVQKTQTRFPDLNGRLTRATTLALMEDVELHDDGSATVRSASDPTRHYRIVEGTCTCRDWEFAPEHLCQHRLAAGLVRKAYELLPQDPAPECLGTTDTTPLYEAPASVNCHIMIEGRQVQLTLRDTDEGRLLQRLQAVLAQYPLPQASSQSPGQPTAQQHNAAAMHRPVSGVCPVHSVAMKLNDKNGRQWYSHYDEAAGRWCKGK